MLIYIHNFKWTLTMNAHFYFHYLLVNVNVKVRTSYVYTFKKLTYCDKISNISSSTLVKSFQIPNNFKYSYCTVKKKF